MASNRQYKHIMVIVLSTTKSEKEQERYRQMRAFDSLVNPIIYNDYVRVAADIKSRIGV